MSIRKALGMALCLTLILLTLLQGGLAAPLTTSPMTMPAAYNTADQGPVTVYVGKSPTSGFDWSGDYRPFLVQISNAPEARPQQNLSEADIVYESLIHQGGYTAYTALYSDVKPPLVSPIRSAHLHHLHLRQEWDCPILFMGGQRDSKASIYDFIEGAKISAGFLLDGTTAKEKSPLDQALGRDPARVSPNATTADLAALLENAWPANKDKTPYAPRPHAFQFDTIPTRGLDTAREITIAYGGGYAPRYTFNPASRQYERWYDGKEQYDGRTGKRIAASNVIIQFCPTAFMEGSLTTPVITTTGSGMMDAFIDGQHIRGTWSRSALSERTVFRDMQGMELTLLPGKTFIQMVPEDFTFTYASSDGSTHTVSGS